MKLKRKWPAYCIWVLFVIFDVVMVASSSFFLGLFPSDKKVMYTVLLTVLGILMANIIAYLLGKISDHVESTVIADRTMFKVIYGFLFAIIVVAGFAYRIYLASVSTLDVAGKISLYNNAVIGGENVTAESDLLSILYSTILKGILLFTGNNISVAVIFEIVLFALFITFAGLAVYKMLGAAASIVFAGFMAFMPIFTDMFNAPELGTGNLFLAMFGLELFIVAMFLKGAYKGAYQSKAWVIWYLLVGVCAGFMGYVDAGTIITVAPFIFAILFLAGRDFKEEIIRLLFVLLGMAVTFIGMLIQEAGFMSADLVFVKWFSYYFHNLNTFSFFIIYTNYKLIYLITVMVMSGIIVAFWKNRSVETVSPWLLSMLIIYVTIPFMGATRMNTQIMVTIFYGFMLACLFSLITTPAEDDGILTEAVDEDEYQDQEEDSEDNVGDIVSEEAESRVVRPETIVDEKVVEEQKTVDEQKTADVSKKRFVPEGMVLPEETEADLEPKDGVIKAKMPEFKGTIAVDRKPKPVVKKDDFDVPLKPGDDFDF